MKIQIIIQTLEIQKLQKCRRKLKENYHLMKGKDSVEKSFFLI
uniref:Uncharacterized protein n=1 Tax=Meloidogyne enterolobii TaxID=390850 RepID=A0A6V7X361_MELEN|nr:unnamed protein product [Meloidogyne enterolobii]